MKRLLVIALILLGQQLLAQTIYYVSPTGNNSNNGTTLNTPFKTLDYAISKVSAGSNTTIYLRGGTYVHTARIVINANKSGTASQYIKVYAYPMDAARPLLDFSSMSEGSSNQGIQVKASYWHIKGIDIKGAGDNGMLIEGGNFNIIEFCSFFENKDSGLQIDGGSSNNRIINCDSYYNADKANGNADGFAVKLDVGSNNYFKGCRAWYNSDDGWDGYLRGTNNVTTVLDSCWVFGSGYLKGGALSKGNGNGFKMGGSDDKDLSHHFTLNHCLAAFNRVKGFDQNNNKGAMTINNGTAYSNSPNFGLRNEELATGNTLTIRNTISYVTKATNVFLASTVAQNNSWQSPYSIKAADFISVDSAGLAAPRGADGSLPHIDFMHLASGSQFIDKGVDLGLSYLGTAPDLGAFEYKAAITQYIFIGPGVWSDATKWQNNNKPPQTVSGAVEIIIKGNCTFDETNFYLNNGAKILVNENVQFIVPKDLLVQ
ncbi:right-handed parallel beta-helix repeat-containing protein [Polluticaenibacter yanchengensis]|uniref:Right-handed parallel beta-helix repeat-containing protein n=1 Tax=Polluticaenibacter yanchengensis TaxID=3014562 RepID=A0ABT4UJU3_9BACT|nr:right-handed parallel beta-helix repeat-containing protein [Chitinophagaceae bacterium LY-5]